MRVGTMKALVLCGALLAVGCGDDSTDADAGPRPDSGGGADAARPDGGGPQDDSLTVAVRTGGRREADRTPIEGATVALDGPGGRVEMQSGADGRVTFTELDLSAPHMVTAYVTGRSALTLAGLTAEGLASPDNPFVLADGAVAVGLGELPDDQSTWVTVSGTAQNMVDAGNVLTVSVEGAPGTVHQRAGTGWSVDVPPGVDFAIIAGEAEPLPVEDRVRASVSMFHQALRMEVSAVTEDTELVLDFADPDTTAAVETASGSFVIPESPFFDPNVPVLLMRGTQGRGFALLGLTTRLELLGGRFEYDIVYVPAAGGEEETITQIFVNDPPRFSVANLAGIHVGTDDLDPRLLEPLDPVRPAFGTSQPIGDAITWDAVTDSQGLGLSVLVDDRVVWQVAMPTTATEVTLPALPSAADADGLLDGDSLEGRLFTCRLAEGQPFCDRFANGRAFELMR